jgi:CubicO group peptidase (beta-lactamase class C family)
MRLSAPAILFLFGLLAPRAGSGQDATGSGHSAASADMAYPLLVQRVVARGVQAGGFPGAAIAIGSRDSVLLLGGFGRAAWEPGADAVSARGTAYDLASLTKVVATTSAIMLLLEDRRLRLDDRVARHLPEFGGQGRDGITIRDLLLHRGGLPAGPDLRGADSPAAARRAVLRTPLAYAPRSRALYSDVGPMLLAMVAERVAGEPFDRMLQRRVFAPLGMRATGFRPGAGLALAPTIRDAVPAVHDANARRLGGVAGHAGLFSTAADLARFARMLLNGGTLDGVRIFREETVARFTARQAAGRALGWDACVGGGRCGLRMSDAAYGHTGFTGTSLWIDPAQGVFAIVLSNAVLDPRAYDPMAVLADVRADVADLAVCAANSTGEEPARLRAEIGINWFHAGAAPVSLSGN